MTPTHPTTFLETCGQTLCAVRDRPVVLIGDKTYGRVAPDDVKKILKEYE